MYSQATMEKRRAYTREWKKRNKVRVREYENSYYQQNAERLTGKARQRYQADPEKFKERLRHSQEKHREKRRAEVRAYREAHREQSRQYTREWARKHPDRVAANNARYHARLTAATTGDLKKISAFYRGVWFGRVVTCHWCGIEIPKGKRTVDHVIPLARGGAHDIPNLAPCCRSCNCRKSAKMPAEFKTRTIS